MTAKEKIYDALNGQCNDKDCVVNGIPIRDDFAEGSECDRLYSEAYSAKCRLNQRLGAEDDPDVECLLKNMTGIMRIISMSMFEYGYAFGEKQEKEM